MGGAILLSAVAVYPLLGGWGVGGEKQSQETSRRESPSRNTRVGRAWTSRLAATGGMRRFFHGATREAETVIVDEVLESLESCMLWT